MNPGALQPQSPYDASKHGKWLLLHIACICILKTIYNRSIHRSIRCELFEINYCILLQIPSDPI